MTRYTPDPDTGSLVNGKRQDIKPKGKGRAKPVASPTGQSEAPEGESNG